MALMTWDRCNSTECNELYACPSPTERYLRLSLTPSGDEPSTWNVRFINPDRLLTSDPNVSAGSEAGSGAHGLQFH